MARFARIDAPGESFHIISRFVNGEFRIPTPGVRRVYLRHLERAVVHTDWALMSYAAMSSHSHLLGEQHLDRLETLLRSTHGSFARFANEREHRHGPVFSDRATSILVRGAAFRQTLAYIHNNPVRAGLVTNPAHSTWTSHRAYIGLAPRPRWLAVERGLELAGFEDTSAGRHAFHEFVVEQSMKPRDAQRTALDKERVRARVRRAVNAPAELESPILESEALEYGIRIPSGANAPRRAIRWEGSLDRLAEFTAHALGLDLRGANVRERALIHSLALRVACLELGRPIAEAAGVMQIAQSTASRLLRTERARRRFDVQGAAMAASLRASARLR